METKYLQMLPGELADVVAQAEDLARCTVNVRPNEPGKLFTELDMGLSNDGTEWDITIKFVGDEPTRLGLIHEVLHLDRNLIQAVHRLVAAPTCSPGFKSDIAEVENDLEHLWIIPREREFAPAESDQHWSPIYAKAIVKGAPVESVRWVRSLIRHWGNTALLFDHLPHKDQLEAQLKELCVADRANQYASALRHFRKSKLDTIHAAVRMLVLPQAHLQWERFIVAEDTVEAYALGARSETGGA